MKRSQLAGLAFLILMALNIGQARASTPHIGGKCLPVGKVQKMGKFTFACTKNRTGLSWQKYNPPVFKNIFPTPTPVPSLTPAQLPTPIPTPIISQSPTSMPTPLWEKEQLQIFHESLEAPKTQSQSFDIHYSPTVDVNRAQTMIISTERAIAYWKGIGFTFPFKLHMVFLSELDQAWWERYKNSHNTICANRCDDFFMPENATSYGGGVSPSNFGSPNFQEVTIQYYIGTKYPHDVVAQWALDVEGPHEYTHAIQFALAKNTFYQLPCWFIEGAARFYERALFDQSTAPNAFVGESSQRIVEFQEFQRRVDNLGTYKLSKTWNEMDYLNFIKDHYTTDTSDDSTCSKTLFGYKVGSILMEKFYDQFSSTGFIQMLSKIDEKTTWAQSFEMYALQSESDWLKGEALPYLLSSISASA